MRKEATIEQWKELYESATRLKSMKPWETFWDLDIIAAVSYTHLVDGNLQNGQTEYKTAFNMEGGTISENTGRCV